MEVVNYWINFVYGKPLSEGFRVRVEPKIFSELDVRNRLMSLLLRAIIDPANRYL